MDEKNICLLLDKLKEALSIIDDNYVDKIRSDMKKLLEGHDGIKLN